MIGTINEYSITTPLCIGLKERTIIPPKEGWQEKSYYVVEIAYSKNNVIHRAIFYTGFLNNGEPQGYNAIGVFNREDYFITLQDLFYCKSIRLIGDKNLNIEEQQK